MRRADRLFRIVQRLRRRGVTTARDLAQALEVSERTVYRDVRDLLLSGVPIQGEAGVGYALDRSFDRDGVLSPASSGTLRAAHIALRPGGAGFVLSTGGAFDPGCPAGR